MKLGSVEAGGTKFVCAIGNENLEIEDLIHFPTTTPEKTLHKVVEYFNDNKLDALSIASFGPIDMDPESSKYGYITKTPKLNWEDTDFLGFIKKELTIPVAWTTDVNGSAYGEYIKSEILDKHINSLVYYTIGTGVGAGTIVDGKFVGGLNNPEMGHTFVKKHPDDMSFEGICPFHGDCLEGLVSGPTFEARIGRQGSAVSQNEPVWDIMAYYVAQAALQSTLTIRPDKIVFGGGVTSEEFLRKVRIEFKKLMNNYVEVPPLEKYITIPFVENNGSATIGNFAMAKKLFELSTLLASKKGSYVKSSDTKVRIEFV